MNLYYLTNYYIGKQELVLSIEYEYRVRVAGRVVITITDDTDDNVRKQLVLT